MSSKQPSLSYKDAGVDIDAGEALVERIKGVAKRTARPEVMGGLGGFGALCEIPAGYSSRCWYPAPTGGHQLRLALNLNKHDSIGQDLVAMCVNDLVVCGAEPLFFLDYYATGKLNVDVAATVVTGIGAGCELAGCSWSAARPPKCPACTKAKTMTWPASASASWKGRDHRRLQGPGRRRAYRPALLRPALQRLLPDPQDHRGFRRRHRAGPTRRQAAGRPADGADPHLRQPLLQLIKQTGAVKAMAHITGGGLLDNIPRVLPDNAQAVIDVASWNRPAVFDWLQEQGNADETEMHRVLNCGVGMVICVAQSDAEKALKSCVPPASNPGRSVASKPAARTPKRVVLNNLKNH